MPADNSLSGLRQTYRRNSSDSAKERNLINRLLAWARGVGGIVVRLTTNGLIVDGSRLISWSSIPFGFSIGTAGKVTIKAGEFQVGKRTPIQIPEKIVTITENGQYVGIEIDWDWGTAIITDPDTAKPISDDSAFRVWKYLFGLSDSGEAYLIAPGHPWNVVESGLYAADAGSGL